MASRAYQRLRVVTSKRKNAKPGQQKAADVFLVRKTGYYNLWINGNHYYYDKKEEVKSIKQVDMHNYFIGSEKKGRIIVRRK